MLEWKKSYLIGYLLMCVFEVIGGAYWMALGVNTAFDYQVVPGLVCFGAGTYFLFDGARDITIYLSLSWKRKYSK